MSELHYKNCPKCGARNDSGSSDQCAACGIYYAKWLKAQLSNSSDRPKVDSFSKSRALKEDRLRIFWQPWLAVEDKVNPIEFAGRCLLFCGLVIWGWFLIRTDFRSSSGLFAELSYYSSFMGSVTLVFHEAGHVLFIPFGRFMMVMGGSLFQLLVPFGLVLGFVYKYRNAFGGSVALWWLGYAFIDLGPYIYDAKEMQLLLLGGGTGQEIGGHDWNNLLTWTGSLHRYESIAAFIDTTGELLMVISVGWGAYLLKLQLGRLRRKRSSSN